MRKKCRSAVWSCGNNKSPGPDGFTIEFIKHFWDLFKGDMVEAFNDFAKRPKLPKGFNTTFITLIPKIHSPTEVKDFRPISLISIVYKILSKMMANRLKVVLPSIISNSQ